MPKNKLALSRRASRPFAGVFAESLEPRRLLANDFAVAAAPTGVVSADFNNDGRPDLATSNNNGTGVSVSVLLGKADGTFTAGTGVSTGATCSALVAGDFNNDGKADLAVARYDGNLSNLYILVGNGDGTFAAPVTISSGRPFPAAIVTGYFNNDTDLDLAVVNFNVGGTVSVLLGGTGATFSASATIYTVGDQSRTITAGDFNGDGKTDLATASFSAGTVSILTGTGTGTFNTAFTATTGVGALGITAGDFNNDGRVDIATSNTNGSSANPGNVSVLLNNGNNTFNVSTIAVGIYPRAIVAGDFNADGKVDLAVANQSSNNVTLLTGGGTGTFTASTVATGNGPDWLAAADINNDGRVDLAVANNDSATVSVRLNAGPGKLVDGLFATPTTTVTGPVTPGPSLSADFDNDGLLDLAVSSNGNSGLVRIFKGAGNGTFTIVSTYTVGAAVSGIVAADFNGDGNLDLATSAGLASGSVSILFGVGNATFAAGPTLTNVAQPTSIAAGDFNGDGNADLAVCNYVLSGSVQRWLGDGAGNFGASTVTSLGGGARYPASLTSGDFNNDGRTDLATANLATVSGGGGSTATALRGNADGTFTVTASPVLGGNGYSVAFGDFNGDGAADLAVGTDTSGGQYYILPGNGAGSFAATSALFAPGVLPYRLLTGDFNNDGKIDLAAANSSQLAVLLGNGAGQLGAFPPVPVPAGLQIAAGDFNGDGRLDILGAGTVSTSVTIGLNQVPPASSPAVVSGVFTASGVAQTISVSAGVLKQTTLTGVTEYYNTTAVREYRTSVPLTVNGDLGRSGGLQNVAVTLNNISNITFNASQHLTTLAVGSNTGVTMSAGRKLLRVKSITGLGGTVVFDLNNSDMIYDYSGSSPQSAIRSAIGSARNNGAWNGYGLTSTAAKNNAAQTTTLGFMEATEYKAFYGSTATFDGEAIDSTAVVLKYALYGDSNFSGTVDFNDFLALQTGFGGTNTTFASGNFNNDAVTDFNDFLMLQTNFGAVLPSAAPFAVKAARRK